MSRSSAMPLRRARRHKGSQSDHVVLAEFGHDGLHQRHRGAGARSMLNVVKLAENIDRAASGQPWNIADALIIGAVADAALEGLAVAASGRKRLSGLDAAARYISDERGMGIAHLGAFFFFGALDDSLADSLLRPLRDETHIAFADKCFGNRVGLNHFGPDRLLHGRRR